MSFFQDKNLINTLSEAESAIYIYIVNNTDKVQFMRVRDIAKETHTSSTTVFRFIRKLGYDSFPEFKLSFKQALDSQSDNLVTTSFDDHFDILNPSHFSPDLEYMINRVVERMLLSQTIVFCGMGASGAIAAYASRKLANLGYNSFSIDDPTYPIKSRFHKTEENVLIMISLSGETTELVELVMENTNSQNVYTVCITGNRYGKIAKLSDYVVDYEINNERNKRYHDLSSQIPALFIVEQCMNILREKSN